MQSDVAGADVLVHEAPPLVLVYIPSPQEEAASRKPSEEEAIEPQFLGLGADVSFHEVPLFVLTYIPPEHATAASLDPSEEEVISLQSRARADVLTQETPPSALVYTPLGDRGWIYPATAASFRPSEEEAMERKSAAVW